MPIIVHKAADIVGGEIFFSKIQKDYLSELAGVLFNLNNLESAKGLTVDLYPVFSWKLKIPIGSGMEARIIEYDLRIPISNSDPLEGPIFFGEGQVIYFRDRLFVSERIPKSTLDREEIVLRVKKAIYDEESELNSLRSTVANLEAAIEYKKSGPRRDPIPEDVKLVVWTRDGGACVHCGSKENLHFDHIIPIAKGGNNSEANIQILCQTCNLKKSDKITMT
jgi:hypothetical protein